MSDKHRFRTKQAQELHEKKAIWLLKRVLTRWFDLITAEDLPAKALAQAVSRAGVAPGLCNLFEHCASNDVEDPRRQCEIVISRLVGKQLDKGVPASWLWQHGPEGKYPRIVIDEKAMESVLRNLGRALVGHERERLRTRLVIHEIAHLDLHWDSLRQKAEQEGEVVSSSPEQEEEAWLYTEFFLGLTLGNYALDVRTPRPDGTKNHDDTWLYL
ncbi:MAG: hypothetical protein WBD75_05895 [Phycisphaerae bacterium]